MEETVRKFINSQPDGVKISEMEETLRQSRLRLGYVTRKLLNEGKVVKIENKYYPTPSPEGDSEAKSNTD